MFRGIPKSDSFTRVQLIDKGWSGDEKFHIVSLDGDFLARISALDKRERREREYAILHRLDAQPGNFSRPVDFGLCDEGKSVYTLLTWLPGEPLEEVLPTLPEKEQRRLGMDAGRILKSLHALPAPADAPLWEDRFSKKVRRKVEISRACPIKEPSCADFEEYALRSIGLFQGRPSTFQHGDYHVGNMVLSKDGVLGVLDFDRMDWGDPWEEFNRLTWSVDKSPIFASAMLQSYFGGDPPAEFWALLALYVGSNQLSCISWAIPFGQKQIDVMVNQCRQVRAWYRGAYGQGMPIWFQK